MEVAWQVVKFLLTRLDAARPGALQCSGAVQGRAGQGRELSSFTCNTPLAAHVHLACAVHFVNTGLDKILSFLIVYSLTLMKKFWQDQVQGRAGQGPVWYTKQQIEVE